MNKALLNELYSLGREKDLMFEVGDLSNLDYINKKIEMILAILRSK